MSTKTRSELQLAADRVRKMQLAVDNTKSNLLVCKAEYQIARMAYEETQRNLNDTADLLFAQTNKLNREIASVRGIVGYGPMTNTVDNKDEGPF